MSAPEMNLRDLTPNNCDVAVKDWISLYKANSSQAIVQLFQMLFHAAGFERQLTVNILETKTTKELINFFKENIPERVPPISNNRVQVTFAVFFQTLIPECGGFLLDHILLDSLFSLLFHMSQDKMRVFRLLGTLVGLKCVTALLQVEMILSKSELMGSQQLEAEKSKETHRRSEERIESLTNSTTRLQEDQDEIHDLLHSFAIKVFFRKRVLDVLSDIQSLCISELSGWMLIDPKTFMVHEYFRWVYVLLASRSRKVRSDCLKAMNLIYEQKAFGNELLEISKKFLNRLVMMTLDESLLVSALAIKTLTHILETYGMLMVGKVAEEVRILVLSRHTVVAKAAGEFLLKSLDPMVGTEGSNNAATTSTGILSERKLLLNLACFLEKTQRRDLAPFLVDALLPSCPALLNWPAHTDLLLRDDIVLAISGGEVLPPGTELALIQVLTAAVHQACSGESPRGDERKNVTKPMQMEISLQVTTTFMPVLPKLLQRHCNDSDKEVLLLGIFKYTLGQVSLEGQHFLIELAKVIEKLFEIHTEEELLRECCQVEKHLRQNIDDSSMKFHLMWDNMKCKQLTVAVKYLKNITTCLQSEEVPDTELVFALGDSLKKIVCLLANQPFSINVLWDESMYLLEETFHFLKLPHHIVINLLIISHVNLQFNMKLLCGKDKISINDQSILSLRSKVLQFLRILEILIQDNAWEISKTAYFIICHILLIFGENLTGPQDRRVTVMVTQNMQQLLQHFVDENVFMQPLSSKTSSEKIDKLRYTILEVYMKLFNCNILKYEYVSWICVHPKRKLAGTKYKSLLKNLLVSFS